MLFTPTKSWAHRKTLAHHFSLPCVSIFCPPRLCSSAVQHWQRSSSKRYRTRLLNYSFDSFLVAARVADQHELRWFFSFVLSFLYNHSLMLMCFHDPLKNKVSVKNLSAAPQTLSPVKEPPPLALLRAVSSQRCSDCRSTQPHSCLVKHADDAVLPSQTRPPGICGLICGHLLSGAESQRDDDL